VKQYRLTQRAKARLTEIARWTIERFGIDQALRYEAALIERVDALASGEPPHGRSCDVFLPVGPPKSNLSYYQEGSHYIIYQDASDMLTVIDFVHGARNFERVLADLENNQSN
jgi:plasmid stabilization system protein ParE